MDAADYEVLNTACYCMKVHSGLRKLSILILVLSEYRTICHVIIHLVVDNNFVVIFHISPYSHML